MEQWTTRMPDANKNNIMDRGEQARKGAGSYADTQKSSYLARAADWENNRKGCSMTVMLSQPRSGSTLMMRMNNQACYTHVSGDHDLEFYQAMITIYNTYSTGGQYGRIEELDLNGIFSDTYRNRSREQDERMIGWHVLNLLMRAPHGFTKSTILGFGNQMVEPFLEMIRSIADKGNSPVHVVFLTRDHNDIVKSLQTKEGPGQEAAIKNPEVVLELLDNQFQQFRSCYEIGDQIIKYEDILEDPLKQLLRLKPQHYPNEEMVKKVMKLKIR